MKGGTIMGHRYLTEEEVARRLRAADTKRKAGVEAMRAVRCGQMPLAVALDDERIQHVPVHRLLRALPKVGKTKAELAMKWADVMPWTTCRAVSPEQREKLLTRLSYWPSVEPFLRVAD